MLPYSSRRLWMSLFCSGGGAGLCEGFANIPMQQQTGRRAGAPARLHQHCAPAKRAAMSRGCHACSSPSLVPPGARLDAVVHHLRHARRLHAQQAAAQQGAGVRCPCAEMAPGLLCSGALRPQQPLPGRGPVAWQPPGVDQRLGRREALRPYPDDPPVGQRVALAGARRLPRQLRGGQVACIARAVSSCCTPPRTVQPLFPQ